MEESSEELVHMLENIYLYGGYPKYIESAEVLLNYEIYFDICQIIFNELSIKIIKIESNKSAGPTEKLQMLIDLLSNQLRYENLTKISAEEILKGNVNHIYDLLEIFLVMSQIYMERVQQNIQTRTHPVNDNQMEEIEDYPKKSKPFTAREEPRKNKMEELPSKGKFETEEQSGEEHRPIHSHDPPRPAPAKSNQQKQNQNISRRIADIMINEKKRTHRMGVKDNRKNKNEQILRAKKKYKSYLAAYAKNNRAKRIKSMMQPAPKAQERQLPLGDFERIDNVFRSFQYKFRDQKQVYLRRVQQLIQKQEKDRYLHYDKIEREVRAEYEKEIDKQVKGMSHQHEVKVKLLHQKEEAIRHSIALMKKELKRKNNIRVKELKRDQKKILQDHENYLNQQNERQLMNFEAGGKLEELIMDMYKKL